MKNDMLEYETLDVAYNFFNKQLFGGELPTCLITLQHYGARTRGYYSRDRFQYKYKKGKTDEIMLNPDHFLDRTDAQILSTLVHEMVHLWQWRFATPRRAGYHDKEWANRMEEIGLMPSNTGEKGGERTGQKMFHYIIKGGSFDVSCRVFLKMGKINLGSYVVVKGKKAPSKMKYECPSCQLKVWGKPDLLVLCMECEQVLISE